VKANVDDKRKYNEAMSQLMVFGCSALYHLLCASWIKIRCVGHLILYLLIHYESKKKPWLGHALSQDCKHLSRCQKNINMLPHLRKSAEQMREHAYEKWDGVRPLDLYRAFQS
jgi:hypothetical protein